MAAFPTELTPTKGQGAAPGDARLLQALFSYLNALHAEFVKTIPLSADSLESVDISSTDHTFTIAPRALTCLVSGDVVIQNVSESNFTIYLVAGDRFPITGVTKIIKTGTAATGIVGMA